VFFSRQLEVNNEDEWYHWITNRALRELAGRGLLRTDVRELKTGGSIHLMWHKNHRYYRRDAKKVVQLVEEYSDPNIGGALGLQGEALVLEGFARSQFVMRNRDTRSHGGRTWTQTDHDLDFVFERRPGLRCGSQEYSSLHRVRRVQNEDRDVPNARHQAGFCGANVAEVVDP